MQPHNTRCPSLSLGAPKQKPNTLRQESDTTMFCKLWPLPGLLGCAARPHWHHAYVPKLHHTCGQSGVSMRTNTLTIKPRAAHVTQPTAPASSRRAAACATVVLPPCMRLPAPRARTHACTRTRNYLSTSLTSQHPASGAFSGPCHSITPFHPLFRRAVERWGSVRLCQTVPCFDTGCRYCSVLLALPWTKHPGPSHFQARSTRSVRRTCRGPHRQRPVPRRP